MAAKIVAVIHLATLCFYITFAISSPLLVRFYPTLFSGAYFLFLAVLPGVVIIGSWIVFRDCPLTLLEKRLLERECPGSSYRGFFTDHYLQKWLGLTVPPLLNTAILTMLLTLPIFAGL